MNATRTGRMICLFVSLGLAAISSAEPFAIEVVDEQTGRGVPMVELQSTSSARYYTDSSGLVAFDASTITINGPDRDNAISIRRA